MEIVSEIVKSLQPLASKERVEFVQRTFPTSLKVLGVITGDLKLILKDLNKTLKKESATTKIEIAKQLIDTEIFECHQLCFDFIDTNRKIIPVLTIDDLNHLGSHLDNWVSTDCFGSYVLGAAWQRKVVDLDHILKYANSSDFWKRRVSIVATIALNQKARGGTGDTDQTLKVCSILVGDHHDMITKAMSWALRVLSQVDRNAVEKFIAANESHLHKRVLREVNRKLDTGKKY